MKGIMRGLLALGVVFCFLGGSAYADIDLVKDDTKPLGVSIYGQIDRAMMYVSDGSNTKLMHVDNDHSSSRIGIKAKAKNGTMEAGVKFEIEFESNSSSSVDQTNTADAAVSGFKERHVDVYLNTKVGKFSIGQGDTASNGTSEIDLSGTTVVGFSDMNGLGGSTLFYDSAADAISAVEISDVNTNMDGLSRKDRLRYDSPAFAGITLSISTLTDDQKDLAVRYSNDNVKGTKLQAGLGYAAGTEADSWETQINGSVSGIHKSGFNGTIAYGQQSMKATGRDDVNFMYIKIGYMKPDLFKIGSSAFSIDYGTFANVAANDDTATGIGIQYVQKVTKLATELFAGLRSYSLDRTGAEYDSIMAVMTGMRIKF